MEPAASVVARVHNQRFALAVLAQGFGEHLPETWGIHSLDVDVTHSASGQFLHHFLALAYPPAVEVAALGAGWGDEEFLALALPALAYAYCYALA